MYDETMNNMIKLFPLSHDETSQKPAMVTGTWAVSQYKDGLSKYGDSHVKGPSNL